MCKMETPEVFCGIRQDDLGHSIETLIMSSMTLPPELHDLLIANEPISGLGASDYRNHLRDLSSSHCANRYLKSLLISP